MTGPPRHLIMGIDENTSDGFHTFKELYEHRIALWLVLCKSSWHHAWRSRLHSDGSRFEGWFVLGLFYAEGKQLSYHLPDVRWVDCEWARTLERVPDFDGHSPNDVLERLRRMLA